MQSLMHCVEHATNSGLNAPNYSPRVTTMSLMMKADGTHYTTFTLHFLFVLFYFRQLNYVIENTVISRCSRFNQLPCLFSFCFCSGPMHSLRQTKAFCFFFNCSPSSAYIYLHHCTWFVPVVIIFTFRILRLYELILPTVL